MARIFLRHGEAVHNVDERFYRYGDDSLLTLTPKGFQDAIDYAPKLASHFQARKSNANPDGYNSFSIMSSDSIRAKQTSVVLHHELVAGDHSKSFLESLNSDSSNSELNFCLKFRPVHVQQLREFYFDETREHYVEPGILNGGFDYSKFQGDIDYQRGISTSFREMTARLFLFLQVTDQDRANTFARKERERKAFVNVSHHYAIAAAVAAYLVREDFTEEQNESIMRTCMNTYIHKGLVYDLSDLDIGVAGTQLENANPVSSALWAGLIEQGIDSCYPVRPEHYECAELYMKQHGSLPARYKPKNRVSDN